MIRRSMIVLLCVGFMTIPLLTTGQVAALPPVKDPGPVNRDHFWGNAHGIAGDGSMYALAGAKVSATYYWWDWGGHRHLCENLDYAWTRSDGSFSLWLTYDYPPYEEIDWYTGVTVDIYKDGYWQGYNVFNRYGGYTFKCSENMISYAYPVQVYVHTDDVLSVSYSEEVHHTSTTYWTVFGEESSRSDSFGVGTAARTDDPGEDLVGRVPYRSTGIFHQDVHGDPIIDASWLYGGPLTSYITYQWYDGQWFPPHSHAGLSATHEIVVTGNEMTATFTEGTEGGDGQSVVVGFGEIISVDILRNEVWATETYTDSVSITIKEAPINTANHYGVYVNGAYVHVWFLYSEPIL